MEDSIAPSRPNNLPLPPSGLVGRATALAEILRLLDTTRLLTLTGPGGVGKSRLALEVAAAAMGRIEDGAWRVELGSLCDAGLVDHQVAYTLGLPGDFVAEDDATLGHYLESKSLLLVLDNCEHLLQACASLAGSLLRTCPRLHILATSRELLHVGGETTWAVPPLSLPCLDEPLSDESLSRSEAGQLFLERARATLPSFQVNQGEAGAIGRICCQLDGLPLAVELAAARLRTLSVSQIAAHLDDRFRLLTGGSRTDLPHHETLRATVDWSYDLLTPPEQRLFERLAVFRGGFALETAEAVASDGGGDEAQEAGSRWQKADVYLRADVLDLLSGLVNKSLVALRQGPQVRYQMLETIREFAWQRLQASSEANPIRQRHLTCYLDLAQGAESRLTGPDQAESLQLLEVEQDNLRAALAWSQESESPDLGLRLATALSAFWMRVGLLVEGSVWLERALSACREVGLGRMWGLYQAGRLAQQRGEYQQAITLAKQSLALSRNLKDRRGMARALGLLGWVAHSMGNRDEAGALLEEALGLARDSGDVRTVGRTLLFLGELRLRQAMCTRAEALLQESLALYQRMGDGWNMAWALRGLGELARLQGDPERAVAHLRLSLALYQGLNSKPEIPYPLETLGLVAADQGRFKRAARLWGAASALRESIHALLPPSYLADCAPFVERARMALGPRAFARAWAEGRSMTVEDALSLAEATPAEEAPAPSASLAGTSLSPSHPRPQEYGLTAREVEVLRLVADGLTDAQVAEKLVISPRTVGKHLQSIYSKLYLPSRSAATRWAMEHHLA